MEKMKRRLAEKRFEMTPIDIFRPTFFIFHPIYNEFGGRRVETERFFIIEKPSRQGYKFIYYLKHRRRHAALDSH